MNPADSLVEIIDASRRPVKWLSRDTFAARFGAKTEYDCRTLEFRLIRDGQRYGVIDLSESRVTLWYRHTPIDGWQVSIFPFRELKRGRTIRLGDGIEERKDDDAQ